MSATLLVGRTERRGQPTQENTALSRASYSEVSTDNEARGLLSGVLKSTQTVEVHDYELEKYFVRSQIDKQSNSLKLDHDSNGFHEEISILQFSRITIYVSNATWFALFIKTNKNAIMKFSLH